MNVLALDPGRATGWALSDRRTGVYRPAHPDDGQALWHWWGWLSDRIDEFHVEMLVIEKAYLGRVQGADFIGALVRSAHAVAYARDVPRRELSADQARKAVLGKARGWTDSQRMQAALDIGFQIQTDHAADAAILLRAYEIGVARAAA